MRVLETRNIFGNQIFPDPNIEHSHIGEDSIELPHGALIENSEGGLVRIVFVAFERLESILRPFDSAVSNEPKQYDNNDMSQTPGKTTFIFPSHHKVNLFNVRLFFDRFLIKNYTAGSGIDNMNFSQPQAMRYRVLNSKVISASLGKGRHIQLSQPIRLILKHLLVDNVTNPTCVFWNYIDQ